MLVKSKPDFLAQLGITNPLHQLKIHQLILREVHDTPVKYSPEFFSEFLRKYHLDMYEAGLKENGIDGDMILDADENLIFSALMEVDVDVIDAVKIREKYRTYISL